MGDTPWSFLLEVAIRMTVLYLVLLTGLRLMGKRMAGQLSRTEQAALVSLAATVGLPILSPDRGLVAPLLIAAIILLMQRLVVHWAARRPRVDRGRERPAEGGARALAPGQDAAPLRAGDRRGDD